MKMKLTVLSSVKFQERYLKHSPSKPGISISNKNVIRFTAAAAKYMGLKDGCGVLFGEDEHFPGDFYVKAVHNLDSDAFPVVCTGGIAHIKASVGRGFAIHIKKTLGLDLNKGWSFPLKDAEYEQWMSIGVKKATETRSVAQRRKMK